MPHWLRYSDSCFNVIMPEGRNLVIFIEAKDRSLCYVDANKIVSHEWCKNVCEK